ncbi:MAG TPA: GAF domain-containing protein [Planctomycetaceae bacterium]|nr:GAF domain-containing protein [Planctomycetaceae bacterium]
MTQRAAWISYPREGQTIRIDLDKPKVVFGRASNCDVALTIKGVSRAHFTIVKESVGWTINDLSSTNGTYVNGELVSRKRLLAGDEITLGPPGLVPVALVFDQTDVAEADASRDSAVLEDDLEDSSRNVHAAISVEDYSLATGEARRAMSAGLSDGSSILRGLTGRLREGSSSELARRSVRDGTWLIGLFNEMGNALLRSENLDDMLNKVLDLAFRDLPAERGSIWLTNEENGSVSARATRNRSRTAGEQPVSISRSIVNEAVRSRKALLVTDAVADDRFSAATSIDQMNIRSAMCAPLYHDGQVLGFVYVDSHTSDEWVAFSEQHLEVLTALAVFAAVGVEKWRMHEAAEQARQIRARARLRLQVLLDVAKSLTSELDTTSLIKTIMIRARELCDAERCSLFLLDRERGELRSKVVEGADEIRFDMRLGIAGHVATTGEVLNIPDAYQDSRFNPEIDQKTGYRTQTILCTPLRNKEGEIIGVTQLINKAGGQFTEEDEEIMGAFSAQAAVALENAMLFQQSLEIRNYLESILDSIDHLVLTLDEEGRLVTVNGDVTCVFGLDEATMRRKPIDEWYDGRNADFVRSVLRVYSNPAPEYVTDATLHAGDRSVSVSYHVVPLLDFEREQKGVVIVLEDITREKRMLTTLTRHLGSEVAQMTLQDDQAQLRGVRQDVAILFSDIRGYTALTESMDAADVVALLNEYFTLMVDAVFAEQGTLDKYIGDAIMAVFGAPRQYPDFSARACRAALRMQDALAGFNERRAAEGLEPIGVGIGISSGSVISGCIGSITRLEYTCIGDGVNIASRLEGASKIYGVTVLISETTAAEIGGEFVIRELDLVKVIGKQQPIRVYELVGARGADIPLARLKMLPHFKSGLRAYRAGEWDRALEHFRAADAIADDPPSQLFMARCEYLRNHPLEESWDGVWSMTHK